MCMCAHGQQRRGKNYIGKDRLARMINDSADAVALPVDFKMWLGKDVLKDDHMIYYKKVGDGYLGYCTSCNKIVDISFTPKQLCSGKCSNCGSNIVFCNTAFRAKTHKRFVSVLQPCLEGIIERRFVVTQMDKYCAPADVSYYEYEREYYGRGCFEDRKEKSIYHQIVTYRKKPGGGYQYIKIWINGMSQKRCGYSQYLYPNNLGFVYAMDNMQYCGIKEYAMNGDYVRPVDYILNRCPILEKLVQVKMFNLANAIVDNGIASYRLNGCDRNANGLKGFFGLGCAVNMRLAIRYNVTAEELMGIRHYAADVKICTDNDMHAIRFLLSHRRVEYGDAKWNHGDIISIDAFMKYYAEQEKQWRDIRLKDYDDYIEACKELGYDLTDTRYVKPNNFKKAHDETLGYLQDKKDEKVNKNLAKIASRYMKIFGFVDKKYTISIPRRASDFEKEGEELHHCVKTYVKRVAEGNSLIIFIRQIGAENTPFYTLELNPKQNFAFVQCRTKNNAPMTNAIKIFVDKFIEKKVKPYVAKLPLSA